MNVSVKLVSDVRNVTDALETRLREIAAAQDGLQDIQITRIDGSLIMAAAVSPAAGRAHFWAISRRSDPLCVVVVRDGKAFETVVLEPRASDDDRGAVLLGSWACLLQRDLARAGRVHAVCDGHVIFEADVTYVPRFAGRIDRVQNGRISGWAVDLARPQAETGVELLINGVAYTTRPTTISRPDVGALYPGHEMSGFEFAVALDNLPLRSMTVGARIAGTDFALTTRNPRHQNPVERSYAATKQVHGNSAPVSIVVPIYNAPQELRECVESLLAHTRLGPGAHRLILSDDASPDPAVRGVLDDYEGQPGVVILRNPVNRGYTGNINHAIEVARGIDPAGDVVLLNSDTRVTPQWLELLQRCAMQRPSIGTVSAVSDNAGAFSVPQRNAANPTPPWMTEDDHARLVTHTSALAHLRVPTTSGFCMYIRQALFAEIGLFDAKNFARGYGEENDFCMRAGHVGWEHVVADNVIIYHERSASFLGNKTELMDRATALIPQMYPEYGQAVYQAFSQSPEINQMRFSIAHARLRNPGLPRPRVAFVIGVESGGTPQTNMDLMSSIQTDYEPYLVLCSTGMLRIFRIVGTERHEVEKISLRHRVMPIAHDSDSYRSAIADVLQRYAFELVHIRHIGRHGLSLIRTARDLSIPVLFSLHDFYTVCPNVKLLDAENRYCGGRCTEGGADCNVELWDQRQTPPLKHAWVQSWQKMFQHILPLCDGLITTSPYARDLIRSIYAIDDVRFDVIPHARDFSAFTQLAAPLAAGEPLRIFVPGHIVPAKGLDLIREIKKLDSDNRIEFHFAGLSKVDLTAFGIYHGPYERAEFDQLVERIRPHVGAVLSIWPETYSHTLTELWSCGIPVVTSDYGATGERIAQHGGGWALDRMQPEAVFEFLLGLADAPARISARQSEVLDWQKGYGQDYNVAMMAERYKRLYRQTLHRGPIREREVIVLPFGGAAGTFEPVTHLRALLTSDSRAPHVMVWPAPALHMLDDIGAPDCLVIRYHAEPGQLADPCADIAAARAQAPEMELVLELAADAVVLPLNDDFLAKHPTLAWLLAHADRVIGPAELIEGAELAAQIDLAGMVSGPNELERLPAISAAEPLGLLPTGSVACDAHVAQRMDAEVAQNSSACIFRHNAPLVAANFTLIDWDAMLSRPRRPGMVSLVMPTFNRVGMTEKFLRSILSVTQAGFDYEIIVIDNGSAPEARVQIEALAALDPRVRVVCAMVPLMFSVGCNYGASFAQGEYILFVNNDMEAIAPDWLDTLIAPLRDQPEIGITGGRLLFGDRTIQHAGLVFSDRTSLAYHAYLGAPPEAANVLKRRVMQAVTGACMAMRATDWAKLRGFNPLFLNGCEDVDLCLRMKRVLQRDTLYVPDSLLIHHEGKSPGRGRFVLPNRWIFHKLWGDTLIPDDQSVYRDDGFRTIGYTSNDTWLAPTYRTVTVTLDA